MTMATQTSRAKRLIKMLERLLKQDHLYSDEEFDKLYTKYEKQGKGRRTIQARELWDKILESQIETSSSS